MVFLWNSLAIFVVQYERALGLLYTDETESAFEWLFPVSTVYCRIKGMRGGCFRGRGISLHPCDSRMRKQAPAWSFVANEKTIPKKLVARGQEWRACLVAWPDVGHEMQTQGAAAQGLGSSRDGETDPVVSLGGQSCPAKVLTTVFKLCDIWGSSC